MMVLKLYLKSILVLVTAAVFGVTTSLSGDDPGFDERPNIILINLDDADIDLMSDLRIGSRYPTMDSIRQAGLRFTNFHVACPYCGPSRASLFRGQLPMNTGFYDAFANGVDGGIFDGGYSTYRELGYRFDDIGTRMKDGGYRTMLVGKHLNGGFYGERQPGWDDYFCSLGVKYHNTNRFISQNGDVGFQVRIAPDEYRTAVEGRDILRILGEHDANQGELRQPFFLYWAPIAPHLGGGEDRFADMIDAGRYGNRWPTLKLPRNPAVNEVHIGDKHPSIASLPTLNAQELEHYRVYQRARALSVRSVDDVIGDIVDALTAIGELDNTYIMITSDNGFGMGHYRSLGKQLPYDQITKVPFFAMGPGIPAQATANHLISHVDIMPTILEIAGEPIPAYVDGKPFLSLLNDPASTAEPDWQSQILIQSWKSRLDTRGDSFSMLRMYDQSYIEWADGFREYYDLAVDPYQIRNRFNQLSDIEQVTLNATLSTILVDNHTPESFLARPSALEMVGATDLELVGYAHSTRPIRRIRANVRDRNSGLFWNGESWQESVHTLVVDLPSESSILNKWRMSLDAMKAHPGVYDVEVRTRAISTSGKISSEPHFQRFIVESLMPTTTIESPSDGFFGVGVLTLAGGTADNSQISHVELQIQHRINERYWNGTTFRNTPATIIVPVDANGDWSYDFPRDIGRYRLTATSVDEYGNRDDQPPTADFTLRKPR